MDVDKVDILQDLGNIRFLMRNTAPGEEAREASKRFVEDLAEKIKAKPKSERNPLRAVVPDLLFLARVAELLQGLGAKLKTRVDYMDIMATFCYKALSSRPCLEPVPVTTLSPGRGGQDQALSFLGRKVRKGSWGGLLEGKAQVKAEGLVGLTRF